MLTDAADDRRWPGDDDLATKVSGALHEGVLIVTETGRIVWCNETASRLLRLNREQLAGRESFGSDWHAVRLDGSVLRRDEHPGPRALATGEPVRDSLIGIRDGQGYEAWLLVDSTPTRIDGRAVAVTVFVDVTTDVIRRRSFEATLGEIKRTLVQTSLPPSGRAYFTSRNRSVGLSQLVGGDFCGAHRLDDDRYGFFIGDACGHGVEAAGLSLLARHTLRAAGALLDDPNEVLRHLHRLVEFERPDTFLTAIYGYVELGETLRVRFASGGHPLPVILRRGQALMVGDVGPIIGMVPNQDRPVNELEVGHGDQMLLYTDGLVSTRHREVDATELFGTLPPHLLTDVLADLAVGLTVATESDDDVTVLAIGFH